MFRFAVFLVFYCLVMHPVSSQTTEWDEFLQEFSIDDEIEDLEGWTLCLEELKDLHEHPMNINTANREDLMRLPFLSESQIEELHAYIYLHGEMKTLGELRLLRQMDEKTMDWMHLFTYAGKVEGEKSNGIFAHLKSDLSSRVDIPLYYRKGYQVKSGGYAGDPLYHRIRYELGNSTHFRVGVRVEKDAGERFYDSYGAFGMLQDVGIVRRAVVGDYRIGFGEGLVVGGSSWNSKSTPSMKTQSGIRPMTGMDESGFLRGAAVTLRAGNHVDVSAFASCRQLDATLNDAGEAQTIVTGGYHRTRTERGKKNNLLSTLAGGNITWTDKGFHLGATGCYQHFNRPLSPGNATYRRYYPEGNDFGFLGLSYGYSRYRFTFAGETAYSTGKGGIGTVNRFSWQPSRRYTVSAIQRHYGKEYYSFQAAAFAENSSPQNETGAMIHLKAEPFESWQLVSYADFFYNQWPRYRMTRSSSGQEFMFQITHPFSKKHSLMARYQLKRKEVADVMLPHHRGKLQWTFTPSGVFRCQTTALLHGVNGNTGWGIQQALTQTIGKPGIRLAAMLGYFDTPDYDSRIFLYEPSLYNTISSGQYYGQGFHGVLTARWTSPRGRWMLEGKYSVCRYMDRNEQGSDMQTIYSPWKNDLSFLLRLKI